MASKRDDVSPSEDKDLSLFDDELLFADEDDELIFADETDQAQDAEDSSLLPWKVLIVDDEEEVHNVTRLALNDFEFEDRKLDFIFDNVRLKVSSTSFFFVVSCELKYLMRFLMK